MVASSVCATRAFPAVGQLVRSAAAPVLEFPVRPLRRLCDSGERPGLIPWGNIRIRLQGSVSVTAGSLQGVGSVGCRKPAGANEATSHHSLVS